MEYLPNLFPILLHWRYIYSLFFVFIHSVIYLFCCRLMNIHCVLWFILQYYCIYSIVKLSYLWPPVALFSWLLYSLGTPSTLVWGNMNFKIFWQYKMLQAHLTYFLPQSWCQPLLQGILIPFIREWWLKDLSIVCACCYWCIIGSRSF